MKKNVILIDYENIQNVDLYPLLNHDVIIKVFHNKNQKFNAEILKLAQDFGKEKFSLVEISGSGKNAADFHIAYFLGKLLKELEHPFFHIISKDTGFKPLIDYIKHVDGGFCLQESAIADIPLLKAPIQNQEKAHFQRVVEYLKTSKIPKPKRIKTLRNQILSVCKREISESDADIIIQQLIKSNIIVRKQETVSYS